MATAMSVEEAAGRASRQGDLVRQFQVQRSPSSEPHLVEVTVSHSGAPQHEHCDCRGYQFRGDCAHITAVYDAGVLYADSRF